jgi:uncharacterized protein with HEPN domain
MKRKVFLYIKDILENMEKAERFIEGMDLEKLKNDEKTTYAIVRCIEVIGEATKQIPAEIREKYSDIPWRDMAGMRDKLIHFYFGLNTEKVWLVIKEDIPRIKPLLKGMLQELVNVGL